MEFCLQSGRLHVSKKKTISAILINVLIFLGVVIGLFLYSPVDNAFRIIFKMLVPYWSVCWCSKGITSFAIKIGQRNGLLDTFFLFLLKAHRFVVKRCRVTEIRLYKCKMFCPQNRAIEYKASYRVENGFNCKGSPILLLNTSGSGLVYEAAIVLHRQDQRYIITNSNTLCCWGFSEGSVLVCMYVKIFIFYQNKTVRLYESLACHCS